MKIICIGRNYADHAAELKNDIPAEPVVFLKPETALLPKRMLFFIPDFSQDVHHELELVVRINRLGKNIEKRFAHRYYDQVTLGIDFTARDVQSKCKEKGLPWEKAKAFDGSAPIGKWISKTAIDFQHAKLELHCNGALRQSGTLGQMLFDVDTLIEHVSKYFTLKIGDLLFTGTPAGVAAVQAGDHLVGTLDGQQLIELRVK